MARSRSTLATLSFISRRDMLAISAVVDIAVHGCDRPTSAKDVAVRHKLNGRYFDAVLIRLANCGILTGNRGNSVGGYQLTRDPSLVSAADIVRTMARTRPVDPRSKTNYRITNMVVLPALAKIEERIFEDLERISIQDLVRVSLQRSTEHSRE
jgi:Rrf2 family iron-sulfur cluster assembly transcriptional regulator